MSGESLDTSATNLGDSPFASVEEKTTWRDKLDPWLDRGSEWLNPILVKESRQAFKSRQFLVTFSLLLVCCWLWSLFVVAVRSPGIYYAPAGRYLLAGYFAILIFPLTIIIPFSAFRSLAGERDDGTYELLSISTLRPRQIVTGKMSSSMLQMLIYLSVLAPCMTFTYLLRGVDIAVIIIVVFYCTLTCWFLSAMGLMLATLTGPKHWQIFASVFFILFLAVTWFTVCMSGIGAVANAPSASIDSWEFWAVNGMIISGLVAGGTMFLLAATARITPRSENRSSALRVGMVVCHLINFLWWMFIMNQVPDDDFIGLYAVFTSLGWCVFGPLMIGEDHLLSPKIRRGLPKTTFGRVFLTLFCPGPGTGYLFAISNMLTMFFGCCCLASYTPGHGNVIDYLCGAWIAVCYMVIYLGIARLVLRWMGKTASTGPVLGLLISIILVGLTSLLTMIAQFALWTDDYTFMQLPNVLWTMVEVMDGTDDATRLTIVAILSANAAVVFLINMLRMSTQLMLVQTVAPERVVKDEAERNPPPEVAKVKSSPWDDDEDGLDVADSE